MTQKNGSSEAFSRRSLLGRAAGAVGVVSALTSGETARGQAGPDGAVSQPRVRDSFDFGWKFLKGDAPGAQQPSFSDAGWGATSTFPMTGASKGPSAGTSAPRALSPPASAGIGSASAFLIPTGRR